MTNFPIKDDTPCPRCGRARTEWRADNSVGFAFEGQTYCCEGCAQGKTCTCDLLQSAPRLEKNVLDTPDAKAKGLE